MTNLAGSWGNKNEEKRLAVVAVPLLAKNDDEAATNEKGSCLSTCNAGQFDN